MPETAVVNDLLAHLTEAQRRAVLTHDRSILVSAAAGSGKTTVLAERCAALVCDLPAEQCCGIDELLVVTFTEAAAGEMRARIKAAIRKRLDARPDDERLLDQFYLVDGASICTIHSFCWRLVQRFFPQAGVDPQASVLDGAEADLLAQEVLENLFAELYERQDERAQAFRALVNDYGQGRDGEVLHTLLRLHRFYNSLPDRQRQLDLTLRRLDTSDPEGFCARLDELQHARICDEIQAQIDYSERLAAAIRAVWPVAESRAEAIDEQVAQLAAWREKLSCGPKAGWQEVAREIRAYKFGKLKSCPRNLSEADKKAFDDAKHLRDFTKDIMERRLRDAMCVFTADEYREGLQQVGPYVRTIVWLLDEFEKRYTQAKLAQGAVDFDDLQRCTFRLLTEEEDADRPSEVARLVRGQYRHILVDEFQDVDPLQAAIIRLISGEAADPPAGNLFCVGDIKQSIYRFRLAEPKMFAARADEFAAGSTLGEMIHLQENFRSRACIVDAINLIFRPLMSRTFGGTDYDDRARLHAAAGYPEECDEAVFKSPAIELHVLEPITEATRRKDENGEAETGDDQDGESNGQEPADELEGIEREAYLIAQRIREWMGRDGSKPWCVAGRPETPGGAPTLRPITYRDIVILLRSMRFKAEPIANVLRRMGIPVQVGSDDSSLDSTEFRDVLNLLQVLDNRQQDVPLAGAMRSPLLGDPFSESDLLAIRLINRSIPFHESVRLYAASGPDPKLRARVATFLGRLDHYRARMQSSPVADVLWEIYEDTHYLAYVCGLPDGIRRRERLVRLHDLARKFGRFSRQGLRRFLRFLEEMLARDARLQQPSTAGADDDAVRIMTIHASKGLEFPVVIVADLNKPFNMEDCRDKVLVDRTWGISLKGVDTQKRIFFPTLVHQLASDAARRECLSEELRVLYVALTRARERLVLVGRANLDNLALHRAMGEGLEPGTSLPRLQLEGATNMLDWLLPAICAAPPKLIRWDDEPGEGECLFEVRRYSRDVTDLWSIPPAVRSDRIEALQRLAELEPLPTDEPLGEAEAATRALAALGRGYAADGLTGLPAYAAVTALKVRWEASGDGDASPARSHDADGPPLRPVFMSNGVVRDGGAAAGTATHRFLRLLDLTRSCEPGDLAVQLREMTAAGRMTPEDAARVMVEGVGWFFGTPLGRRLRSTAGQVLRELSFRSRIPVERYDPAVKGFDHRDVVLVRGVVDALLVGDEGLELLDYKTDQAHDDARVQTYRFQLDSYAEAVSGIFRLPVTHKWLVFLHGRRIVDLAADGR